jgi:Rod binding domain-containing protein
MIDKISSQLSGTQGTQDVKLSRLKTVCAEFEAIFLSHMLKTMRSSMSVDGVFGKSHQGEILGSMVDEKVALDMAKKRGIGVGDLLFKKLQAFYQPSDPGRKHGPDNHSND